MLNLINILAFVVMIAMNYLANALPINGKTTGELSAQYPNMFTPAGITFSIWGIIYMLLLAFTVLQFKGQNKAAASAMGYAFAISSLLNALWIVAWHYEKPGISLLIILGMLVSLLYINMQISTYGFGLAKAAFGVYLGWVCIATIANTTVLLVDSGWHGGVLTEVSWAIILIVTGLLITVFALLRLQNPYLGLAVVWAFAGIVLRHQQSQAAIAWWAGIAAIAMFVVVVYAFKIGLRST